MTGMMICETFAIVLAVNVVIIFLFLIFANPKHKSKEPNKVQKTTEAVYIKVFDVNNEIIKEYKGLAHNIVYEKNYISFYDQDHKKNIIYL